MKHLNILVVAGGHGTRLWPVSRKDKPKQLLKFINDNTLLEETHNRIQKGFTPDHVFVATGKAFAKEVSKQMKGVPKENYTLEPVMRDRGTAVLLGLMLIEKNHPGSPVVLCWSDHYIKNVKAYLKTLETVEKILLKDPDQIVGIGVQPLYPHTGFEYLECGNKLESADHFDLKMVKMRGDVATVAQYVKAGNCLWNTGYWASTTTHLLNIYKNVAPKAFEIASKISESFGTKDQQAVIDKLYPKLPVLELERDIISASVRKTVVKGNFDWADVGTWKVVKDSLSDKDENLTRGDVVEVNSKGNLLYNFGKKLVTAIGVENLVIINTDDVLLVAEKTQSEESIRALIKKMKEEKKYKKYL